MDERRDPAGRTRDLRTPASRLGGVPVWTPFFLKLLWCLQTDEMAVILCICIHTRICISNMMCIYIHHIHIYICTSMPELIPI